MSGPSIFAIAHRGASLEAPENTLVAIDRAVAQGARAVELDVRLTRDQIPVLLHDATLERTTNAQGPLCERDLLEIRRLDAGSWMDPCYTGVRIPTLDEALCVMAGQASPVLELKVPIDPTCLVRLLHKYDLVETSILIGFEPSWALAVRDCEPRLTVGISMDQWDPKLLELAQSRQVGVMVVELGLLSLERMGQFHRAGLEVWAYTANDIGTVAACGAMGVTGIITDRPDLIRARS